MMPINPQPNRLDQLRASTAPMPMGGNQTPLNTPPVGSMPSPSPAGGGGPQMASAAPMGAAPMGTAPSEDSTRLDDLLGSVAMDEEGMSEGMPMEEDLDVAGGLVEAALNFAGSIPAARAELQSALDQLDAMEMTEASMEPMV